jgi:NAD(P)-dependent dehydrogenase (short-subunit alcohol dehydrogenase family)
MRKVALVTGATRGIGKACAISLAREGFSVVVTGRTLKEGTGTAPVPFHGDTRGTVPVPGSIEATAAAVRELGAEALELRLDVLDRASIDSAVATVLERWGRIDVLVNNALYQGPGLMYGFTDFTLEQLEASLQGSLVNQLHITRLVLPAMLRQGGGVVVGISSMAAVMAPPAAPAAGGWGFAYGAAKSGFHRIAEFLHVEHGKDGIQAFNVEPGRTIPDSTRAMFADKPELMGQLRGTAPSATGDVVAWLATRAEAKPFAGSLISSPTFFAQQGIQYP